MLNNSNVCAKTNHRVGRILQTTTDFCHETFQHGSPSQNNLEPLTIIVLEFRPDGQNSSLRLRLNLSGHSLQGVFQLQINDKNFPFSRVRDLA